MPVEKTFHASAQNVSCKGKKDEKRLPKHRCFNSLFKTAYLPTLIIISAHTISFLPVESSSNLQSSPAHRKRCSFWQRFQPNKPTRRHECLHIVYKDLWCPAGKSGLSAMRRLHHVRKSRTESGYTHVFRSSYTKPIRHNSHPKYDAILESRHPTAPLSR